MHKLNKLLFLFKFINHDRTKKQISFSLFRLQQRFLTVVFSNHHASINIKHNLFHQLNEGKNSRIVCALWPS